MDIDVARQCPQCATTVRNLVSVYPGRPLASLIDELKALRAANCLECQRKHGALRFPWERGDE